MIITGFAARASMKCGFVISPFLLMPLVENCFKHVSMKRGKKTGSLSIAAWKRIYSGLPLSIPPPRNNPVRKRHRAENTRKRLHLIIPAGMNWSHPHRPAHSG